MRYHSKWAMVCTRIADKHYVLEDLWNRLAARYLFHRFPVFRKLIVDIDIDLDQLVLPDLWYPVNFKGFLAVRTL
jgi:hypothetical protein